MNLRRRHFGGWRQWATLHTSGTSLNGQSERRELKCLTKRKHFWKRLRTRQKLQAFIDGAIAQLTAFIPVQKEYEQWNAEKAKHLADLESLRSEAEQHRQAKAVHQFAIDDLLRQKARIEDEIGVVTRDLARAQRDYERRVKGLNR
jgi:hypothetical protein